MEAAAGEARADLDPPFGRLIAPVLFTRGAGRPAAAVHHRSSSGDRRRVVARSFWVTWRRPTRTSGRPASAAGPAGTPFTRWAHDLTEQVRAGGFDEDLAYWAATASSTPAELPADRPAASAAGPLRTVSARLSREQTDALLHQVPGGVPHPDQRRPAHRAGPGTDRVDRPRQRADRPRGTRPRGRDPDGADLYPHRRLVHHRVPRRDPPAPRPRLG